jgi:hypothetical protein
VDRSYKWGWHPDRPYDGVTNQTTPDAVWQGAIKPGRRLRDSEAPQEGCENCSWCETRVVPARSASFGTVRVVACSQCISHFDLSFRLVPPTANEIRRKAGAVNQYVGIADKQAFLVALLSRWEVISYDLIPPHLQDAIRVRLPKQQKTSPRARR